MEKQELQLVYDGDALLYHEIDASDLSKALTGISDLFQEANRVLNVNKTTVKISVKANFKQGSFQIDLNILYSFLDNVKSLFNSEYVGAILNAKELLLLIIGGGGVIRLLKFLKGRKLKKENIDTKGNIVTIKIDDKQFETVKEVLELYNNYKIRKALEDLASPVKKDGIDKAFIKHGKDFTDIVDKESIDYFNCPPVTKTDMDNTNRYDTQVSVVKLSFTKNSKWTFHDGQSTFNATIEDELFWKNVEFGKNFGKNDILKVLIRREQFMIEETNKLKIEHFIEKIYEHKKALVQQEFDFIE